MDSGGAGAEAAEAQEGGGGDVEMPMPGEFAGLQESSAKVKLTPRRNGSRMDDLRQAEGQGKKMANNKYWECLKNHAASMGGHALDGCGEFMALGEEGTAGALKCATCDCHRNFHRRELENAAPLSSCACQHVRSNERRPMRGSLGWHSQSAPPGTTTTTATSNGPVHSDDQEVGTSASAGANKRRFRTKFSTEQKEMMCLFADKLGWKIQKAEEPAVQSFCAGIGVKRHAFKVWLHNNKNTLRKKTLALTDDDTARKSESSEPSERKSESSEPSERKSESSEPSERKSESPEPSERKSVSPEPSERKSVSPEPSKP